MAEPKSYDELQKYANELEAQLTAMQRTVDYLSAENQSLGETVHEYLVSNIKLRTDAKVSQRQAVEEVNRRDTQIKALQVELQNPRPSDPDVEPLAPGEPENPDDVTVPEETTAPAALNGQKKRKGRYAD